VVVVLSAVMVTVVIGVDVVMLQWSVFELVWVILTDEVMVITLMDLVLLR
jgi:hypothetical protein